MILLNKNDIKLYIEYSNEYKEAEFNIILKNNKFYEKIKNNEFNIKPDILNLFYLYFAL